MRKKRRYAKKAAWLAAFCYLSGLALSVGMLKAAQKTRQILYGGQPVMAQISQRIPDDAGGESVEMELGGGEWTLTVPAVQQTVNSLEQYAADMPPCMGKYLLRLLSLADRAADYTARWIGRM